MIVPAARFALVFKGENVIACAWLQLCAARFCAEFARAKYLRKIISRRVLPADDAGDDVRTF